MAWSDTGTSWTSVQIPNAGRLKSIAYAFGKYVVGNVYGKLFSSRDGTDWNEEASGTTDSIARIFPVGDSLIVMSSKAGILRQNAFGNWLSERFDLTSEQQDEQVTGTLSDPDGDGVGNLMEYALDTNPKQAEGSPQPLRMEGQLLYYRYLRSRQDIDYKVECSYSLDAEAWSSFPVNQGSGEVGTFVDASMPLDNRSVFLRLKAVLK